MIPVERVTAYLGKFNLSSPDDSKITTSSVFNVFIHPDWDTQNESFDADIAVVVLDEIIEFNDFIQPACLPTTDEVSGTGAVVGFTKNPNHLISFGFFETTIMKLEVLAMNSSHCSAIVPRLSRFSSKKMFCGHYNDHREIPCIDDSGFFFASDRPKSPVIVKGIVSTSLLDRSRNICHVSEFTGYTNVGSFIEWIEDVIEDTKSVKLMEIVLKCVGSDV